MANRGLQSLYLDAAVAALSVEDASLRVQVADQAERRIPVRRVARAVIRNACEPMLQACLSLIRTGGSVHFQTADGRIIAVLQPTDPDACPWTRELAGFIEHHGSAAPFTWWQDVQQRHAWSSVLRRGFHGDFDANCSRITRLLHHYRPELGVSHEQDLLKEHLRAWLQDEVQRRGLRVVAASLAAKGCDFTGTLEGCLMVTLLWRYVSWRKLQHGEVTERDLIAFFELQIVAPLRAQLDRHVQALAQEYAVSIRSTARGLEQDA